MIIWGLSLLLFLLTVNGEVIKLYCVKHSSSKIDTCLSSNTKHIAAAAVSNQNIETVQKNSINFDLDCNASNDECQGVKATLSKAAEILSTAIHFESTININASYFNFCQILQDCHYDNKLTSIGQAYPTISYIMTDRTDNMTRMYPQTLLKQFTKLSTKPNWAHYDIEAQFNNEVNWYFVNNPNPIQSGQTDFLRNCLHELIHGLGFMSSWDDTFYSDLKPLFDDNTLQPFITPKLLASTNNDDSLTHYNDNQPFWGFVEFPIDKHLYFTNGKLNLTSARSFSSITNELNKFQNSDAVFRNIVDFANAWYQSDAYSLAKSMYKESTTWLDTLTMYNNVPILWLESSINPFSSGSSLCHVDQSLYLNSSDYLMVYTANKGVGITQLDKTYPSGPLGPKLLELMATLGYQINSSFASVNTIRPDLAYWEPSKGLAGSSSNPSPSLAEDSSGPARIPSTSTTITSTSTSTSFSPNLNPNRIHWALAFTCIFLCII